VGIAALPTVTEIRRAGLPSGRLTSGTAGFEKSAFGSQPALLASSKANAKPVVFHKGELSDGLGLLQEVRDAVGTRERRVVAVVYNAVDDHLSGSDQLHLRWWLDDLRLLKPLLHEARSAGRVLLITSDHGHVIDEKTSRRPAPEGDRWRSYAGPVQEGEILLGGGRVRSPMGATQIVCAWSECLRYSAKKNGYHGGVSPQEGLCHSSVFLPPRVELEGCKPSPPAQPERWEEGRFAPPRSAAVVLSEPKGKKKVEGQGELFPKGSHRGAEPVAATDWVSLLLGTTTYQQQRQLAARVSPQDLQTRQLLETLDARGGKLAKAALAQQLGIPLVRLSSFVNAARRVLNVDQSPVLSLDEVAGVAELNRELLEVHSSYAGGEASEVLSRCVSHEQIFHGSLPAAPTG
jgi:hypothetical protein